MFKTFESAKDSSSQRILITGATGFVGVHTAWELVERGYRLRCLVRKTSDISRLPPDVELITGHLLDFPSLQEAVKDCWGVIHIGGIVRARDLREFYRVNRDGTANLVRAAREGSVRRFLLCSSQAAGGPSTPERKRKVSDPDAPVTDYGRSKLAGERALREGAGDMWWAVIRPPAVYGPWDYAFLTVVYWVKHHIKLKLGDGEMPFMLIHSADLARALTLGLAADAPSSSIWYATDGAEHTQIELSRAVEEALGKRAVWITIPVFVAPLVASLIEFISNLRGKTALLSRQKLLELTQPAWTCDDQPFRAATGFIPQFDLFSGMKNTVEWYKEQGII